jgi:hypothetical protein
MQASESTYDKRAYPIARPTDCRKGAESKRFQEEFLAGAQAVEVDADYTLDEVLLGNDRRRPSCRRSRRSGCSSS